jgi:hypothetical protein
VLGAVFAIVLYFSLRGGLIQLKTPAGHETTFFYSTLAFIAGFSERRARIVLGGAERVLGGAGDAAEPETHGAEHAPTRRGRAAAEAGSSG